MAKMTSRARMLATLAGEPVDRLAVSPRIWRYAAWQGMDWRALKAKFDFDPMQYVGHLPMILHDPDGAQTAPALPEVRVEVQKRPMPDKTEYLRTFNTPAGVLSDRFIQPHPGGSYGISPNAEWSEPIIKSRDDVARFAYLLPEPQNSDPLIDNARHYQEDMGEDGLAVFRPTLGVDGIVVDALGPAQALMMSLDDPDFFTELLMLVENWHFQVMKRALEAGQRLIFDAWFNFSLSVGWSPDFHKRVAQPLIRKHADLVHGYGGKLLFYDDGKLGRTIGPVIDAGVDLIQTLTPPPEGDLDFQQLAREHGGKCCFQGGVSTVNIRFRQPEEIAAEVRSVVETLGPTGKYMVGTSDSITEGVPEENMWAFFDTARQVGAAVAQKR